MSLREPDCRFGSPTARVARRGDRRSAACRGFEHSRILPLVRAFGPSAPDARPGRRAGRTGRDRCYSTKAVLSSVPLELALTARWTTTSGRRAGLRAIAIASKRQRGDQSAVDSARGPVVVKRRLHARSRAAIRVFHPDRAMRRARGKPTVPAWTAPLLRGAPLTTRPMSARPAPDRSSSATRGSRSPR